MAASSSALPRVLIGWTQIAEHLGVDRSTAILWSTREIDPLPIGNHATSRVHVAARTVDVDAWRERNDATIGRRKPRAVVT